MMKKFVLYTTIFCNCTFIASTNIASAKKSADILLECILQNTKNTGKSMAKAFAKSGASSIVELFINVITGKLSSTVLSNIITQFFKKVLPKTAQSAFTSEKVTYAEVYTETIKEISTKIFEEYNPGKTGTLSYSTPLNEFLSYSRTSNASINVKNILNQKNTKNDTIDQRAFLLTFSISMLYVDNVIDNLHKKILLNSNIIKLLNSENYEQNIINTNKLFDSIKLDKTIHVLTLDSKKQNDTNIEYFIEAIAGIQKTMNNIKCFKNAYQNTILKINPSTLATYIENYISSKKHQQQTTYNYEMSTDKLNAYIPQIYSFISAISENIMKPPALLILINSNSDNKNKINLDYLIRFFKKNLLININNENDVKPFIKTFRTTVETYIKKQNNKILSMISIEKLCQKVQDYILSYILNRSATLSYVLNYSTLKTKETPISEEKIKKHEKQINKFMNAIYKNLNQPPELIIQINKQKVISDYLNSFFEKKLKLTIENENERIAFMKYFKEIIANYIKANRKENLILSQININTLCKKVNYHITPMAQRKYLKYDGFYSEIFKKVLHPYAESKKQGNTSIDDIYSKSTKYKLTDSLLPFLSWIPTFLPTPQVFNIIAATLTDLGTKKILKEINKKFITEDIKKIYSHITIDEIFVPYVSYVLSKINKEIKTNEYSTYFNYVKTQHPEALTTIIQLYIKYLSENKNTTYNFNTLSEKFIKEFDDKVMNTNSSNLDLSNIIYKEKDWEKFTYSYKTDQKMHEYIKRYLSKLFPMLNELIQFIYCSEIVLTYIKQCSGKNLAKARLELFKPLKDKTEQVILEFLKFFAQQYRVDLTNISVLNNAKILFIKKLKENDKISISHVQFLFVNSIKTMLNLAKYQLSKNEPIIPTKNQTTENLSTKLKLIAKKSISKINRKLELLNSNEYMQNFIKIFFYDKITFNNIIKKSSVYEDFKNIKLKI